MVCSGRPIAQLRSFRKKDLPAILVSWHVHRRSSNHLGEDDGDVSADSERIGQNEKRKAKPYTREKQLS